MSAMTEKVQRSIETHQAKIDRMTEKVRAAYFDGRWQAATPAERARTKANFQIERVKMRRLQQWLAAREPQQ